MTFDASKVTSTDMRNQFEDYYYPDRMTPRQVQVGRTVTMLFDNGSTLELESPEYTIKIEVELVEGRIYHVGKDGRRWLAWCDYDPLTDELVLRPMRTGYPTVSNTNRMQYEFYKEFDLDLKEYL